MLVLSRKENESIQVGEDVTIMITKISKHQVHVGIKAPASTKIVRTELFDELPKANSAASNRANSS